MRTIPTTAPTRPMVEPITAERASIMAPTLVVDRPTGTMVTGVLMARGEATLPGTMAPDTPEDGAEAPLHGMMDRGISAVTVVARLRGAAAPAARRDGGAAQPLGAAAPAPSTGLTVARAHGDGDEVTARQLQASSRHPHLRDEVFPLEGCFKTFCAELRRRFHAESLSTNSAGCFGFLRVTRVMCHADRSHIRSTMTG